MSNKRPARIQVLPSEFDGEDQLPPQNGTVFNIWYNKWSGGGNQFQLIKAKYKLNPDADSGYTKADKQENQQYFCLFFAKGMCCKGKKCKYLHRIPSELDIFPQTVDCFGRDKFSEYRDDMSGVGSFNNINTTLYIGGLVIKGDTQKLLDQEFRKLGKIVKINVISDKNCGFVQFKNEQNAQFAKEAMIGQSLYGEEVLNLKWANEDPNPQAIMAKKREREKETENIVKGLLEKYDTLKKVKKSEPEVEEPKEAEQSEEKQTIQETKQIEPSEVSNSILSSTSLQFLRQVRPRKLNKTLVNAYESDSD